MDWRIKCIDRKSPTDEEDTVKVYKMGFEFGWKYTNMCSVEGKCNDLWIKAGNRGKKER